MLNVVRIAHEWGMNVKKKSFGKKLVDVLAPVDPIVMDPHPEPALTAPFKVTLGEVTVSVTNYDMPATRIPAKLVCREVDREERIVQFRAHVDLIVGNKAHVKSVVWRHDGVSMPTNANDHTHNIFMYAARTIAVSANVTYIDGVVETTAPVHVVGVQA